VCVNPSRRRAAGSEPVANLLTRAATCCPGVTRPRRAARRSAATSDTVESLLNVGRDMLPKNIIKASAESSYLGIMVFLCAARIVPGRAACMPWSCRSDCALQWCACAHTGRDPLYTHERPSRRPPGPSRACACGNA